MKFRKKPVVIEAVQFTGNFNEIENFVGGDAEFRGGELLIATLEGPLRAAPNDWIIKGVKGEFYPCKPDIFEATYEPVLETDAEKEARGHVVGPAEGVGNETKPEAEAALREIANLRDLLDRFLCDTCENLEHKDGEIHLKSEPCPLEAKIQLALKDVPSTDGNTNSVVGSELEVF